MHERDSLMMPDINEHPADLDDNPPNGGSFLEESEILELIENNLDFARQTASHLGSPNELKEDVCQSAYLGLVETANRFDPDGEAQFQTLAFYRVRGRAIDELRARYPVKAKTLREVQAWRSSEDVLAQELGRFPTLNEVAKKMEISDEKAREIVKVARAIHPSPQKADDRTERRIPKTIENIEDTSVQTEDEIIDYLDKKALLQRILAHIDTMREKQRYILYAHFLGGVATSAIAEELGVSFQAVNQVKNTALRQLAVAVSK